MNDDDNYDDIDDDKDDDDFNSDNIFKKNQLSQLQKPRHRWFVARTNPSCNEQRFSSSDDDENNEKQW